MQPEMKERGNEREKADLTELNMLQIRVRSNDANLLLTCKGFSSCSEEPTVMCWEILFFFFLCYSVQLQVYR